MYAVAVGWHRPFPIETEASLARYHNPVVKQQATARRVLTIQYSHAHHTVLYPSLLLIDGSTRWFHELYSRGMMPSCDGNAAAEVEQLCSISPDFSLRTVRPRKSRLQ
jgi:hypothetical protein